MKLSASVPVLLLVAGLLAQPLAAQRILHATTGDDIHDHGYALAAAGDVDADGTADYWVAAPNVYQTYGPGSVLLVSGADGTTLQVIEGANEIERFGFALAGGADLSEDGVPDLVVGAPQAHKSQRGAVRVFSGADGTLLYALAGRVPLERFGEAVTLLDDVDGDGTTDFAAGAPGDDRGATDRGSVRVHSGATGALLGTLFGSAASDELGAVLASAGDVDRDGMDDLFAGVPRGDQAALDCGRAVVYSGRDARVLHALSGDATGDDFGRAVAGAGDLDGDGVPDLAVGAPGGRYARTFSGANGAVLWSATRTRFEPPGPALIPEGARFGWAVCGAGDQDRDGRADLAVGYPEYSGVWLLSGADGSTLGVTASAASQLHDGASLKTYYGFALAAAGDLDGDGASELAVGAPTCTAVVFHSPNIVGRSLLLRGGLRRDWAVSAEQQDALGSVVGCAGDVDRDGLDDVAYGRLTSSVASVVVLSGKDRSLLRAIPCPAPVRSIARAGDVDLDGTEDLVVGSDGVSVFSGATGAQLHSFVGDAPADLLGFSVAGLGDVNGDGHADVAASAPRTSAYPNGWDGGFCAWTPPLPGYVRVYSGADGARLFQVDGQVAFTPWCDFGAHVGEVFGFRITGVGDWDRDGTPDLAVGAPGAGERWSGAVRVFSGTDGTLLREFMGQGGQANFGISVSGGPDFDFDADGFVDLVVGEQVIAYGPHPSLGGALVFSSFDGALLFAGGAADSQPGYGRAVGPGYSVAALADFDGDGHSDVAVGNPTWATPLGPGAGEVRIVSGADSSILQAVSGTSSWDYLGYAVAAAGDTNGDGATDLVIGSPRGDNPSALARVRVVRSAPPKEVDGPPGDAAPVPLPR